MSGSGGSWSQVVPVAGQKVIEADPRIVDAFKNIGYSLPAAVADLVDNSVDAGASVVLIRFLHTEGELVSLVVVDDGRGMPKRDIDRAMQFGGRRQYGDADIGMYGMGLKSASLSQAESVTVLSKAARSVPVGRRWTEAQAKAGWKCDVIPQDFVAAELQRPWLAGMDTSRSGTIIRWDQVRDFQKATGRVAAYLRTMRLSIANHLALQLHRFLEAGRLTIVIDAENIETGEIGVQTVVVALDPFSYPISGATGYPKKFNISIPGMGDLEAMAHIWPARAKSPGYTLGGGAVSRRQGFYFYRNDRLIQAGGWNNYRDDAEPHLSLARVEVDLPRHLEEFFSIRFSKSGVDAPLSFVSAVQAATSNDGTSFAAYIDRAIDIYRAKSNSTMKPVVPPGPGLGSNVRKAIKNNFPVIPRDDEVTIRWRKLPADSFFEIDRESRVLVLNSVYRRTVLGDRAASKADAPVVKALLFLLLNDMFRTQRESAVERSTIAAYQAVLVSAVRSEMK
jgi:transposase InsO family protein